MERDPEHLRIIGQWLLVGVAMLVVQIALGGITRLTGSGLSMTDWNPIMDAFPPLSEAGWQEAFEGYKKIGQYQMLNADFTLADFKFIYFWEWLHRNWARLILVAFAIPFCFFLYRGYFKKSDLPKLFVLLSIGLALALIGWIMVASGLNETSLYVDHFKLALHFCTALFLIALTFWYALEYLYPKGFGFKISVRQRNVLILIIAILGLQLTYGAFMAGLKAAQAASTWPTINGDWLPNTFFTKNIFNNKISVHFIHRSLGYLLAIGILLWTMVVRKKITSRVVYLPSIAVFLQVLLGVLSVLYSPKAVKNGWGIFEWNAQLHQLVAMVLLLSLVYILYLFRQKAK